MTSSEIRTKYLEFFRARGHAVVPSSSLIPTDPSVLLTSAGMQQFKLYFTGDMDAMTDFGTKSTTSCQKSFRTSDIDEVGDERHDTFFEMLGNFSFGGYFKKEAITYAYEFITREMGLPISYVTIFEGKADIGVPRDDESEAIWKSLDPNIEVREQGMSDVFWGPTGSSGPCGPTTEIYCKNDKMEEPVEVWNIVFNQYFYPGSREELNTGAVDKKLEPLPTPGVDTGMGLERLVMCVQGVRTIFETDLFAPLFPLLPESMDDRKKRICADHARASVFLIADGVEPSNKGAGYILRRVLRRLISIAGAQTEDICKQVIRDYQAIYPELGSTSIIPAIKEEQTKFASALGKGLSQLERGKEELRKHIQEKGVIDNIAQVVFDLFQSYGLPSDVSFDELGDLGVTLDRPALQKSFDMIFEKHREISRAGVEKKFGGHGLILDTGEIKAKDEHELKIVTRLHTATHMLQQALRDVLGNEVRQAGSDITAERTRFDFTFGRKLTPEEIKKVEARVNEKMKEDLPVDFVELPKAEAEKTGALYFFKAKYGEIVKVYYMGKDLASAWSKEFCGGPHVHHTNEVGDFKIVKEEAVSAGVRRIRGVV